MRNELGTLLTGLGSVFRKATESGRLQSSRKEHHLIALNFSLLTLLGFWGNL